MKQMRNNIMELMARKARKVNKTRISLRAAAGEMGISYYTLNAMVQNTIREYPAETLGRLCDYLECNIGDLLSWEEVIADQAA